MPLMDLGERQRERERKKAKGREGKWVGTCKVFTGAVSVGKGLNLPG